MKTLLFGCAALVATTVSPEANAAASACPGFVVGGTSPTEVDQFYASRAISIVRASLKNDTAELAKLVAAHAKFDVWRGDYSTSAREQGVPGAMAMVRDVKPIHFQTSTILPGPLIVPASKCEWSVQVLFRTEQSNAGVTLKFDFVDGLLVQATGHEVKLADGDLR